MTLMGQKRDPNEPRKVLKRTGFKRKASFKASHSPVRARTGAKPSHGSSEDYEAFMARFRGLPCAVCGTTHHPFLRLDSGLPIPTVGHHLLYQSTHPEHKMNEDNILPLCVEHHVPFAHDKPEEFKEWLRINYPVKWKWMQDNNHHRTTAMRPNSLKGNYEN